MKNFVFDFSRSKFQKLFLGIFAILVCMCFTNVSSAMWITGHPYYVDLKTESVSSMATDCYTLQFIWIDPSNSSVNIIGGDGSSNPVYYYSNGTYAIEFPDEWEDRAVFIGTYPRNDKDDPFYASYHPSVLDFENAESVNLGSISETSFNPGSVGKEIIERPQGMRININGNLIFPRNTLKGNSIMPVIISLYQDNLLISSSVVKTNNYSLEVRPEGTYTIKFSSPEYKTAFANIEIPSRTQMGIIRDIVFANSFRGENNQVSVPKNLLLGQNYPNPFNPSTKISFAIPAAGLVSLKVFDISGKEVSNLLNEFKLEGNYEVNFNASNLSSGIYYYSLSVNGNTITKKLTLLK